MNKHGLLTHKGFTLVEMAIVLVIVGLLVGLGSSMIGPLTSMAKLRETREIIDADMSSVVSWGASNSRIPNAYTEFQTVISKQADAYGNPLYYFFDSSLVTANICGRRPTNSLNASSLTICRTSACIAAERVTDVAYAIISGGDNRNPQTGIITCPAGISGTCIGVYDSAPSTDNCTTTTDCPAANVPAVFLRTAQAEEYDDVVRWVTLDELRSKIGCQGAQLKILNNELPYGNKDAAYPTIPLVTDGGVQFAPTPTNTGIYEWCWSSTRPQTMTDLTFTCVAPNTTSQTIDLILTRTPSTSACSQGAWNGTTWLTGTGTWQRCTKLTLSSTALNGTNPPPGSYDISLLLRDGGGSFSQKSFVLTVNP